MASVNVFRKDVGDNKKSQIQKWRLFGYMGKPEVSWPEWTKSAISNGFYCNREYYSGGVQRV